MTRRRSGSEEGEMPWTEADVDGHKKGLSQAQKKKWCDIANGVLADCKKRKGKDCEALAIRVASSKVGK